MTPRKIQAANARHMAELYCSIEEHRAARKELNAELVCLRAELESWRIENARLRDAVGAMVKVAGGRIGARLRKAFEGVMVSGKGEG